MKTVVGQIQEEANQAMLHKGGRVFQNINFKAYSSLGTDNHSSIWWKELDSQDLKQPLHEGPGSKLFPDFKGALIYYQYLRP